MSSGYTPYCCGISEPEKFIGFADRDARYVAKYPSAVNHRSTCKRCERWVRKTFSMGDVS